MKKLIPTIGFWLGIGLTTTSTTTLAQDYPGVPDTMAAELHKIGPVIDPPATTVLYAPLFSREDYAGKTISRDLAYGPHERHRLDVFTTSTAGANRPVVVFVHGGGFSRGAKSAPGSPFYDNIMNWAAEQGFVGVNINYRLAPEFKWPSGIEDLTLMVDWLHEHIHDYGGNAEQIFLWGHSAGAAHTADYLAYKANRDTPDRVAGAVLTSGFYTLADEASLWSAYYGNDTSKYAERSSLPGLLKTDTPIFANDAELDTEFAITAAKELVEAFKAANKPITYVQLADHSHLSETFAVGTEDKSLSGPVKAFIHQVSQPSE